MAANKHTLHKTKLELFKQWLELKEIPYRAGKGHYQALQVLTPKFGWQCVFIKDDMPEHFSVNDKLMPLVRDFIRDSKEG